MMVPCLVIENSVADHNDLHLAKMRHKKDVSGGMVVAD
jgi:hypothetical protein